MKAYVLVYAVPYSDTWIDGVYLAWKDAEKERLKKRPRKHWEILEIDLHVPKGWKGDLEELIFQMENPNG